MTKIIAPAPINGVPALWFDVERAKKEEKRSRLSKAFSKLFRRRPKTPPPHNSDELADRKLSQSGDSSSKSFKSTRSGLSEVGSQCKQFFGDIFAKKGQKPKPVQETIPAEFQKVNGEIIFTPIQEVKAKEAAVKKTVEDGKGPKEFQKLTVERWRKDQARIEQATFPFTEKFCQKYRMIDVIGEGSFGFVMAAERLKDGREVAVKMALREKIPTSMWHFDPELGLIPSEAHALRQFNHPNIVHLLDYFDEGGEYVLMVTELHGVQWTWPNALLNHEKNLGLRPAGQLIAMKQPDSKRRAPCDLFECIESHLKLPEKTVYTIFRQLLEAVIYLRDAGWVHRDLKDENIVVDEQYRIKLVDFGSASRIPFGVSSDDRLFKQFNGTLAFAAPEIVKGLWYDPVSAEVWTLGILLYTLVYKRAPFTNTEEILSLSPGLSSSQELSSVDNLISLILEKSSSHRISLDEIGRHPWMLRCHSLYQ